MFRSKLFWRLYTGYVAVILVCTLIVGVMVSRQVTENGRQEIYRSLEVRSELLAEISRRSLTQSSPLINTDIEAMQQTIVALGEKTNSRLTVITAQGNVVADSQESPENMDNHGQRPEILVAKEKGVAVTSRFSQTLQQEMIYRAQRLVDDQGTIGFVRVSLPLSTIDEKLAQLQLIVLFGAAIAAAVALFLGLYIAKLFTDPLTKMTEIAESISRGDYEKRITVKHDDEIGTLASAFNRMAKLSAQRMTEITTERNRLAMIFAGMKEGVIAVDQLQNILHVNHAAAKLFDLSMTQCINRPFWQEIRIPEISQALEQAIETHEIIKTHMRRPSESGDQVVEIYAAVLAEHKDSRFQGNNAAQPELSGAIIVFNDISEVDRLERIRRDFVANASHELKTPITAIRGIAETILADGDMEDEVRQSFIGKINIQSQRLSSLVSDLMALSRLESGQDAQSFHPVDLIESTRQSVRAAEAVCQEKALSLTLQLSSGEKMNALNQKRLIVAGDKQAILQLIDNLLDNAIKYTPTGGKITVSLSMHQQNATLAIQDSGVGISHEHQQRIFERFYRVDKARSRELGGTGLGLSIAKNIVELHGGSITIESQLGEGSTFFVTLPLV